MSVLYKHIRNDKNTVFYIGIGSLTRAYNKTNRTRYWKAIVNKYGYSVEIVFDDLTTDQAKSWERYLIGLYGRKDLDKGCLINVTDGGESSAGAVRSEEFKRNLSRIKMGVPRPQYVIQRLSECARGRKSPLKGKERIDMIGGKHPLAIKVTDGVNKWDCIKDAAGFYELSSKKLGRWLRSNSPKLENYNLKYLEGDH